MDFANCYLSEERTLVFVARVMSGLILLKLSEEWSKIIV
jgi:hypothetical protein